MGHNPGENSKIVKIFSGEADLKAQLREEDLENFSKSLLIFGRKSVNYNSDTKLCQVASLADLKTGSILKVKPDNQTETENVIPLVKTD